MSHRYYEPPALQRVSCRENHCEGTLLRKSRAFRRYNTGWRDSENCSKDSVAVKRLTSHSLVHQCRTIKCVQVNLNASLQSVHSRAITPPRITSQIGAVESLLQKVRGIGPQLFHERYAWTPQLRRSNVSEVSFLVRTVGLLVRLQHRQVRHRKRTSMLSNS